MRLEGIAADLGVSVVEVEWLPHGRWGEYRHWRRSIRLLSRMAPVQYYSTLAHELGHAYHGHHRTTPQNELEADVYAARILIARDCWWHVTAAHEDLLTVAAELQVLPRIAGVYAKYLARHPALHRH